MRRIHSWVIFFAILGCAVFGGAASWAGVVLVEDGEPTATIVTAVDAPDDVREAAYDLSDHIERMTGVIVPVRTDWWTIDGNRILVGQSPLVQALGVKTPTGSTGAFTEEGFIVRTVGNDLVLVGNEDGPYQGSVYAVYHFLELLGCRWFFPGEYGMHIPERDRIEVPELDIVERPSFRMRNLWYAGWNPIIAREKDNEGNVKTEGDGEKLHQWALRNKLTARLHMRLPGDGSISRLAPASQYFETHPHIYAINKNGERWKGMLCISDPDTLRISVNTIRDFFEKNPDEPSFAFAPPDGFPMCHCDRCQDAIPGFMGKGYGDPSFSDAWFVFANAVATAIHEEFPDKWIFTNGYSNRVRPPEGVRAFSPNLGIQSAIIAACSIHRIGDPKCWQRVHYKQILDRWTDTLNCVFIYDYDPGNALENLPFPTLHNLRHDILYFRDRGIWGFWTEGSNSWMVTHLNYYIRAKLMWNADADVDVLVRDYCERFYGNAAEPVEEYIWTLEKAVEQTHIHETWGRIMVWREVLAPVEEKLAELIEQAEEQADTDDARLHVRVLRLVHDHMMAYVAMERAVADGDFRKGVELGGSMIRMRYDVGAIEPGLLPPSNKLAAGMRSSLEWHMGVYKSLADTMDGTKGNLITLLPREWGFKKDPEDVGVLYQWYLSDAADGWHPIDTTLYWEAQGHEDDKGWGYSGKAWYRTAFDVPADAAGKPLWLTIGAAYNTNEYNHGVWVWVNGVLQQFEMTKHWRLGHQDVRTPFHIDVTQDIRPGETNRVAVLVHTGPPGRNPRGGLHRRSFLWTPVVTD